VHLYVLTLIAVCAVIQASSLPSTKVFVEIAVGDLRRRTEGIKRKENACTWHDAKFALYAFIHPAYLSNSRDYYSPILGGPSKFTFSVLQEHFLHHKCLGRLEIDVDELLERQCHRADDGECLFLVKRFYYD
jgi:hypothetical protein